MQKAYSFSGQRQGESIEFIVKGSPWQLFPSFIQFSFLVALGIISTTLSEWHYFWLVLGVIFIVASAVIFKAFYCFIQTTTVITNQRVVNVAQKGLWTVIITESELPNIKEITTIKKGIVNYLTNTGDVILSTNAGDGGVITIQQILNPYDLQQKIAQVKQPS